jgi:pantothenate kinase
MKDVLSDNYQDVEELIRKLKGRMHDIEKDIMENGGDGPDWMYLDGYNQCVNDLEKLTMEEDNE